MRTYIFPYYISLGKLDSVGSVVEVHLSEKDSKRLEKSAFIGGRFRLDEDSALTDIFNKVYAEIHKKECDFLRDNPDQVIDRFNLSLDYKESSISINAYIERYLDELVVGINYPEDLQFLDCTIKQKVKQSHYESVLVERSGLQNYMMLPEHNKKVIYTDRGSTLYFIPSDFSGSFTIPSSVNKLENRAFFNHQKLIKIIVDEGLTEISDCTFEGCTSLEYISLPSTVKKVGYNAFSKCAKLKKIDFSEGLLELDSTAFRMCSSLEELCFPASLIEISAFIDSYSSGLKTLIFSGMNTVINDKHGGDLSRITISAYPGSAAEKYATSHRCKYKVLGR